MHLFYLYEYYAYISKGSLKLFESSYSNPSARVRSRTLLERPDCYFAAVKTMVYVIAQDRGIRLDGTF